ncbi:fatty acid hydroxylase [Chloropicon primus]|uniref:Fatty acid hydroxylase n=1 Tax=Chloropicon primus TaxID=1764295 RepID=A0A5B8ME81_9CHLO|nr:fatty acid hydroxylase [Chloropicon primus]UPQ98136.1 fatty acid hydroxylase [Chloropicon primus]|mmetsp:Transcript_1428/g.4108  ORF Transcript_1428/g.4108 Transcript_1428/m.4108 type:complete len:337 (+) Transcript_1428:54-1064(+)|eukprot:QDZ18928.1 fatty acid hydroxylase [Chloropicon primus]
MESLEGLGVGSLKVPPLVGGGFPVAMLQLCSVYYVGALAVHSLIPRFASPVTPVAPGARKAKPESSRRTKRQQILRESLLSIGPIAVKAAVFCAVEKIHGLGLGLLYDGALGFGTSLPAQAILVACTVLLLDALHDTWFYFTHLLMHRNRWLYLNVHYLHHQSRDPTPFSGYSLHVVEALIVFFDEVIVCFLFPMHVNLHRLYHLYTTLIHIGGHASYELHPLVPSLEQLLWIVFHGDRVAKGLNTVLYHNMHHQFPNKNFSLYFTHWDRLCETMKWAYPDEIQRIKKEQSGKFGEGKGRRRKHRYYFALIACMTATLGLSLLAYLLAYNVFLRVA